jgi:hypothetical protein
MVGIPPPLCSSDKLPRASSRSMDAQSIQSFGMYGGIISILLHCGQAIYAAVNHTRVRSNCCGRVSEVSLDVEKTTPPGVSP